jgi:hypothetical protein
MPTLTFDFETKTGAQRRAVHIGQAVIAGWTGRDAAAVEKHIAELEKIGVKRPATTPIFYRVAAARLTTGTSIEVSGAQSSGEVEFVLVKEGGRRWVGVGSDHTDRKVESYGVTVSKQMCDKPVAPTLWSYDDVAPHWNELILRSRIVENGTSVIYQEGSVAAMLEPPSLLARYNPGGTLSDGTLMFCGTLGAIGGVRPSPSFEIELHDPVLARTIRHRYDIVSLPILG